MDEAQTKGAKKKKATQAVWPKQTYASVVYDACMRGTTPSAMRSFHVAITSRPAIFTVDPSFADLAFFSE